MTNRQPDTAPEPGAAHEPDADAIPGSEGRPIASADGHGSRAWLRRHRTGAIAGATVLILAAAALGVDLTVEQVAQQRVVSAASCRLAPSGHVSAELTSSFAGLRVVTGDLGTIRLSADDVRREGLTVDVRADLHHVTTKGTTSGGTATATVGYDQLQQRLGSQAKDLSVGSRNGQLVLTGKLGPIALPISVETTMKTGTDSITVTPTSVDVLGQSVPVSELANLPGADKLRTQLAPHTVALPELPANAVLTGARATDDGLQLQFSLPRMTSAQTASDRDHSDCGAS